MQDLQSETWQQYFRGNILARIGQRSAWLHAAQTSNAAALIVLPTGYGKTLAACGYYAILRGRGLVNRCLWLVPTDALRTQLVPTEPDELNVVQLATQFFGIPFKDAIAIEKEGRDYRYHRENRAEIFVATYQQVVAGGFFPELLESGNWLIVCDETHHLAEDARWGQVIQQLPATHRLYMSATPIRSDRKLLAGVPTRQNDDGELTYDAAVDISYVRALEEQAIRRPKGHIQHYYIDATDGDGQVIQITTEMLRMEGVTDFSTYEIKRELRYNTGYLATIIRDAMDCLNEKLLRQPGQHQELVFAMSCLHAESVAKQYNYFEPGCADWIGIARPDKENKEILAAFKKNQLKVLVQVDKAGEGFDNARCSVLVFLHLIQAEPKLFQQMGRGLRRNSDLPFEEDVVDVFASADTPVAQHIIDLEAACQTFEEKEDGDGNGRGPYWGYIPDLMEVAAYWYRTDEVTPKTAVEEPAEWIKRAAKAAGTTVEQLVLALSFMPHHDKNGERPPMSEANRLDYYRGQVKTATGTLIGNVVRKMYPNNNCPKDVPGELAYRINREWVRKFGHHGNMVAEDFKRKYEWLQEANNAREIPQWLRL